MLHVPVIVACAQTHGSRPLLRPSGRRVVLCRNALLCVALQRAFTGRSFFGTPVLRCNEPLRAVLSFFRAADLLPHDRLDRLELRVERIPIAAVRRQRLRAEPGGADQRHARHLRGRSHLGPF
jgi:hypothetical protein